MTVLAGKLGLFQAIGVSISIIAPTAAMALNVALTAQAAGRAAPLAFAIGTVAMALVGVSFVSFGRRIAHAGSVLYVGVTGAQLAESLNAGQITWALSGLAGTLALIWPLYNSVYPVPDFPRDLWPGVVIAWILAGGSPLVFCPVLRIAGPE